MKKVLHISTTYLKPSETFIYSFVKNHVGYSPHVLTEEYINEEMFPKSGGDIKNPISVHLMPKLNLLQRVENLVSKQLFLRNTASEKEYGKIIEKVKPDIMLAHFGQIGMYAVPLKRKYNIPLVTYFYGIDLDYNKLSIELGKSGSNKLHIPYLSKGDYWKDGYQNLWKYGDAFLTFSSKSRAYLISVLGAPEEKVFSIPGGVDLNRFKFRQRSLPKDGKINFVTVNRLVEKKGVEYAIKAMPKILLKYPNAQYDIMGKGPLLEDLTKLVANLGLVGKVNLLGFTPNDVMDKKLNDAHVFLNPSIVAKDGDIEGWVNVTLMESIASGLPAVATYESGSETIYYGKSGYICCERDPDSIVEGVMMLLSNPKEYEKISKGASEIAEKSFSDKKQTLKLEDLFDNLISSN